MRRPPPHDPRVRVPLDAALRQLVGQALEAGITRAEIEAIARRGASDPSRRRRLERSLVTRRRLDPDRSR
jgi:hypothetical protein